MAHGAAFLAAKKDSITQTTQTTMKDQVIGMNPNCFSPFANSDENTVNPTTPITVTRTARHTRKGI